MKKKIIGWILISIPFAFIFLCCLINEGWKFTIALFIGMILLLFCIFYGVKLTDDE